MCHIMQHKRSLFSGASKKIDNRPICKKSIFQNSLLHTQLDCEIEMSFAWTNFVEFWILTKIKSLTSSIEILWIANGEHVVFLSQKLINYTLTINPWEQMNTKEAILASLNGGFYFLGFRSLSLCCLIFGQLYFSGFYFSKK